MKTSSEWYRDPDSLEAAVRASYRTRPRAPVIEGYEDLRELSRGGQGVVYTATQRSTKRIVAIKVLLDGLYASHARRIRFEREIDLVASLRHPSIVSVYDSGITSDDRVYLVMEYIEGLPLDAFTGTIHPGAVGSSDPTIISNEHRDRTWLMPASSSSATGQGGLLPLPAAMTLFSKICDAMNYAHQHGVIHRDLKPSNIRVDAQGDPHILDFGLAKIADTASGGSSAAALSVTGQFMGSIPWASPEQAEGDARGTDTRSDVYSLGVILYQMITGQFPYQVNGNLRDVLNNILSVEPARPSTLRRQINDEVETIVLKCLEKDAQRRYQSAGDLALDVKRYLAGEPIEAKRASAWYAVRKTLRRYQMAAGAMIAILVISVVFAITAWTLYRQTNAARLAEEKARHAAQQEANTSTRIREFLETMLTSIDPEKAKGRDITLLVDVLKDASARIETELADEPAIAVQLHSTIGATFNRLTRYADAEHHLVRAHELSLDSFGADDTRTIATMNDLGALRSYQGRHEDAETILHDALEASRRVRGPDNPQTLEVAVNLALTLKNLSKLDESEQLYREVLAIRERAGTMNEMAAYHLANNLGTLLHIRGNLDESEEFYRQAMEGFISIGGEEHPDALSTASNLAFLLSDRNKLDEAEQIFRRSLEVSMRVLGEEHAYTMTLMNNLAHTLQMREKTGEAEILLRQALAARRRVLGEEHDHTLVTLGNLAYCLQIQGKDEEALALQKSSVEILRRVYGDDAHTTMVAMNNLASQMHNLDQVEEAHAMLSEVVETADRVLGPSNSTTALFRANLGNTLTSQDRFEDAETNLLHSHQSLVEALGPDHPHVKSVEQKLVRLYDRWGRPEQSDPYRPPPPPKSQPVEAAAPAAD